MVMSSPATNPTTYPDHAKDDYELLDCQFPGVQKCLVRDFGTCIELISLQVLPNQQGRGSGTKAVKMLQRYGKPIHLIARAHKGKKHKLLQFYKRLGFVVQPDNSLLWKP